MESFFLHHRQGRGPRQPISEIIMPNYEEDEHGMDVEEQEQAG
jgi:hypothetical protein